VTTPQAQDAPRILAVASGKGGAGKSMVSANLGIYLATLGKRVALIDASFGAANLHHFVGMQEPERALSDMLAHKGVTLDQVIAATSVPGLGLVAGQRDPAWAGNPKPAQLTRLRAQMRGMRADYVILDLGAGTGGAAVDLWLQADYRLLILTPEPTSIELAYRLIKTAFVRRLSKLSLAPRAMVSEDELHAFAGGIPAPLDLFARAVEQGDEELAGILDREMRDLRPFLVVNFARSKPDMDLGAAITAAARRRLGLPIRFLGHLEYDDAVWVSLRRGRPLLIEHPEARISKCIEKLARRMLGRDDALVEPSPGDSHYELLEVDPSATEEEIRRANRRIRQIYGRDSIVIAGLYGRTRLEALHRRLDEAYDVLMDPRRRKQYDLERYPDGVPAAVVRPAEPPPPEPVAGHAAREDLPPMPEIGEHTQYTGQLMQAVREARGLDLREIASRTKIGLTYLAAIESEAWNKLPAAVYVRGFLVEYAKLLDLDVPRVLDTYLLRYREARGEVDAGAT
jgi:flagellar biosynthesis protein FlhG